MEGKVRKENDAPPHAPPSFFSSTLGTLSAFSLVEIMVGAGMLGLLSLGAMSLMKNISNSQNFAQATMDYMDLSSEVDLILSSRDDCEASFKGESFYGFSIKDTPVSVELWTADNTGARSRLRVSSAPGSNKFGRILIDSVSFTMPDKLPGTNFPIGISQSFKGVLEITGRKKISATKYRQMRPLKKSMKFIFTTVTAIPFPKSTITSCSSGLQPLAAATPTPSGAGASLPSAASPPGTDGTIDLPSCAWSDYTNSNDENFDYNCPDGKVIQGVHSVHNNHHEDRRFKFYCCSIIVTP